MKHFIALLLELVAYHMLRWADALEDDRRTCNGTLLDRMDGIPGRWCELCGRVWDKEGPHLLPASEADEYPWS